MAGIHEPLPELAPENLSGLRVLIFGLGSFGGGAGAARFFCERGAEVSVTDLRSRSQLASSVADLERLGVRRWCLGEHREQDFECQDWVVVNPAIPPGNRFLKIARAAGARLVTELGLFLRWCPSPFICGVTGTNGKSTTVRLVHNMLHESQIPVHLGGNIGTSLLPEVAEIGAADRVVLEISSFQLERLEAETPRPPAVAITQFSRNHLDWHGSEGAYLRAKEKIFTFPRVDGPSAAVLPLACRYYSRWSQLARRPVMAFHGEQVPRGGVGYQKGWLVLDLSGTPLRVVEMRTTLLRGAPHLNNAACAAALAMSLGAHPQAMVEALRKFRPLPHRQELVAEGQALRFVNDSKATTPEATLGALEAFGPNVVLLAGGSSKEEDFQALGHGTCKHARAVVVFGETALAIEHTLLKAGFARERLRRAPDLALAFVEASRMARPGDTVLLSPACASYDQYGNYEERGVHFRTLAREWCHKKG